MMRFSDKNTPFHRIDPRTKVILSLMVAVLVVVLNNVLLLMVLFLSIFSAYLFTRPSLSNLKILVFMMATVFLSTMISQGFFYYLEPKTPVVTIVSKSVPLIGGLTGGLQIYREGLIYGAVQSLRLIIVMTLALLIVLTTYPSDLILGLTKFGLPQRIGFMLMVSIRFLPSIIEEARRILIAQKLRGLKLKGLRGVLRGFRHLTIPLVINCLRSGRQIALAAEVRAFTERRTSMKELKLSWFDPLVVTIGFLLSFFLIYMELFK